MPDNRKPLIYGAFPVCRNYTVRAHLRNAGAPERRGRKDGVLHAGTLRCGLHPPHLHPRHTADAAKGRRENGQLHGADSISPTGKQSTGKETVSSPVLFKSFYAFRCVGHGVGQAGFVGKQPSNTIEENGRWCGSKRQFMWVRKFFKKLRKQRKPFDFRCFLELMM